MEKYIITGPGASGKTTLLDALSKRGYTVVTEVARDLIKEHLKENPDDLIHATQPVKFQKMVIEEQGKREANLEDEIVFLDRGFPDNLAFIWQKNLDFTEEELKPCYESKYDKAFLLDQVPLEDKGMDGIRVMTPEEREKNRQLLGEAYAHVNIPVVRVPYFERETDEESIEARVNFVLKEIGEIE